MVNQYKITKIYSKDIGTLKYNLSHPDEWREHTDILTAQKGLVQFYPFKPSLGKLIDLSPLYELNKTIIMCNDTPALAENVD
jgi:hypothetical protein